MIDINLSCQKKQRACFKNEEYQEFEIKETCSS